MIDLAETKNKNENENENFTETKFFLTKKNQDEINQLKVESATKVIESSEEIKSNNKAPKEIQSLTDDFTIKNEETLKQIFYKNKEREKYFKLKTQIPNLGRKAFTTEITQSHFSTA